MKNFWEKVNKTKYCWEWTACLNRDGYGQICIYKGPMKTTISAHRMSWTMKYGSIPKGMLVCHKCDNQRCVRPSHLFLGTNKDNRLDCVKKNRCYRGGVPPRFLGEDHQNHKLTEKQVREIRKSYTGKYGEGVALAKKYKVDRSCIYLIVVGKNWKHI